MGRDSWCEVGNPEVFNFDLSWDSSVRNNRRSFVASLLKMTVREGRAAVVSGLVSLGKLRSFNGC